MKPFQIILAAIVFFLSLCPVAVKAQNIGAFEDDQKWFYVFDAGVVKKLEFNPVKNYTVGGSYVTYTDFQNRFKVYYKGNVFEVQDATPQAIGTSDYLLGYTYFKQLKILWNDKINTYETWAYKPLPYKIYIYWNGQTFSVEKQ